MLEECWNFNTVEPPLQRPVYGPGGQSILLFKPLSITAIPLSPLTFAKVYNLSTTASFFHRLTRKMLIKFDPYSALMVNRDNRILMRSIHTAAVGNKLSTDRECCESCSFCYAVIFLFKTLFKCFLHI